MAAALPVFRQVVADAIVDETAKANASFAVTTGLAETIPVLTAPLNLGDMVILTKNQLIMGYKIALAAGRNDDPRSMLTEILGVIGGGFMFRQVARQLVGLIPVAGLVPKVAIAYAGTYAMGRGLTAWALGGTEVTAESLSRYTAEGLDKGRELAQQLIGQVKAGVPSPARSWQRLRGWLPSRIAAAASEHQGLTCMRVTVIVNPAAGTAEDRAPLDAARRELSDAGHQVDVRETSRPG